MAIFDFLNDPRRRRELVGSDLPIGIAAPETSSPSILPNISQPNAVTPPFAPPGPAPMPTRPDMTGAVTATPPIAALPDTTAPRNLPAPRPPMDVTGIGTAMPKLQGRGAEMNEAREAYLAGTPGRKKSIGLGILQGAAQGLASGGGLGAALGGAVTGGAFGGLNPRGQREMEFNRQIKPKIIEGWQYEDQDRAQKAAAAKAALDAGMNQAQLAKIQGDIDAQAAATALNKQKADQEANKPLIVPPGASVMRPGDKAPVFTAPARPTPEKAPTAAELSTDPESGKSAEEIANDSFIGRGGPEYVFGRLPKRTQQLLNGEIADANPAELMAAQRTFDNAIKKEQADILRYTQGEIRSKVLRARSGATSQGGRTSSAAPRGAGQGSGVTRSRSEFNSSKFPGMKFD